MLDDHSGVALNSDEIFFLEGVAGFSGHKHFSGEGESHAGVLGSDGFLGGESFVNAHDEFGNVMEPGELCMVHDEPEEFAGVDVAVLPLIVAALHFEECLVKAEKGEAERDQLFAGHRVVIRGV